MRRRIEIIAHDTMLGRDTPSPGLERASAYVVREFERLGLRPAGEDGGFEQRWGLSRWIPDPDASELAFEAGGRTARVRLGRDARLVAGASDGRRIAGEALLLDGPLTAEAVAAPELRGRIVAVPVDYGRPLPADLGDRVEALAATAAAVILLSNRDSATFEPRLAAAAAPKLDADFRLDRDGAPILEVHDRAVGPVLAAVRGGSAASLRVSLRLRRRVVEQATAPNLIGVLDGADEELRSEYVVVSAHVDGVGIRSGARDSIHNGADDNASGVAGLLELAERFSDPARRPRRSLLFLVPSGEEKGLWGSEYYAEHPTVPLEDLAALINMDLIGRNWTDSVIAVGPEFTTLGETLRRVTVAHPELRMTPLGDRWPEERIFYRSDHYHFARRGVPILFFTSGTHPDYHQPTDEADRVNAEKASRVVRLLHHLIVAVADDSARPRWFPEWRREIVRRD